VINLRNNDGNTPLYGVCINTSKSECVDVMNYLFEHGASALIINNHGQTFLHTACHFGNIKAAQCLVLKGVNVNAIDIFGNTALHLAFSSSESQPAIIHLLISYGADVSIKNNILMYAHDYSRNGYMRGLIANLLYLRLADAERRKYYSTQHPNGTQIEFMLSLHRT